MSAGTVDREDYIGKVGVGGPGLSIVKVMARKRTWRATVTSSFQEDPESGGRSPLSHDFSREEEVGRRAR